MSTTFAPWTPAAMVTGGYLDTNTDSAALYAENLLSRYDHLKESLENVETPALLAIAIMGFVGACFSLVIFLRERSSPNDFLLYKIISSCAAAQMLVLTIVRLSTMYGQCEQSYVCSFFWAHISISIMNVCADAVDFLILFLGIERTCACLLPVKFSTIDKLFLERMAVMFAFAIAVVFSIIQAFELTLEYDAHENRYHDSRSKFAESEFYSVFITANTIRFYVTACAIVIATMFSVFGFWRTARRSLIFSQNREKRREMDLCCLQLCTAAPVVINHLLYAISLRTGHYAFDQIQPYLNQNRSSYWYWSMAEGTIIDSARVEERLRKAEAFEYLKTSINLSDALAHALQFYFYLIFCLKVRQGFLALWSRTSGSSEYPTPLVMEQTPILTRKARNEQGQRRFGTEETISIQIVSAV